MIVLALQPVVFDRYVLAFDIAGFFKAFAERAHTVRCGIRGPAVYEPDHWQRRLLRPRRQRPRRRPTKPRDELPPSHPSSPQAALWTAYRGRGCLSGLEAANRPLPAIPQSGVAGFDCRSSVIGSAPTASTGLPGVPRAMGAPRVAHRPWGDRRIPCALQGLTRGDRSGG